MRKDSEDEAPRLGWAVVRERAAIDASGPLPDLPPLAPGAVPHGPAEGEEPYRLAPVSFWAHLPPRRRPASFCPICIAPVTLKLGTRNRHHYAHEPDSVCAAASGEGALHLAAKLLLAEALGGGGDNLSLRRVCARVPGEVARVRCAEGPLETLPLAWDTVEIERSLPSLRADLMLTLQGRPVLALEVRVTHAVDERKSAALKVLGIPWLEIDAARLLPLVGAVWNGADPLPVVAHSEHIPPEWRCAHHAPLFAEIEAHRLNGVHRLAWRVAHLYRRDAGIDAGRHRVQAVVVSIFERRSGGVIEEAWLERHDRDEPLCDPVRVRTGEAAIERLHQEFLAWGRRLRAGSGAGIDSPMRWTDGAPPSGAELARLHPQRYRLDPASGTFVAPPGIPRFAWPLPLLDRTSPHPIFGESPVAWEPSANVDTVPATVHAIAAPLWITLRLHRWGDREDGTRLRIDVTLHRHDGTTWTELGDASFSHPFTASPGTAEPVWSDIALRIAEQAAAVEVALSRGRIPLYDLARHILP